jgi:hypothetical protein
VAVTAVKERLLGGRGMVEEAPRVIDLCNAAPSIACQDDRIVPL